MAAVSLFCATNMAVVMSCINALLHSKVAEHFENCCKKLRSGPTEMTPNEIIFRIVKFPQHAFVGDGLIYHLTRFD